MRKLLGRLAFLAVLQTTISVGANSAFASTASAADSATPVASPTATEPPPALTLSAGVGLSPGGSTTTFALRPKPGSSPATQLIGFGEKTDDPALAIILLANYPFRVSENLHWLTALGQPYGTIGIGTNKTDLIAGFSWGSRASDQTKNFLTIGVRQFTTQDFQNGFGVGSTVPGNASLSSLTFVHHVTRLFVGYTVDASALGCILPLFATPSSGCGNNKASSASPAPTTLPTSGPGPTPTPHG